MHCNKKILLLIFNLFWCLIEGCQFPKRSYKEISALFDAYPENDERALVFVNLYIKKAKKEHNLKKTVRGYEEAIYYSGKAERKLLYADSAIVSALQSGDCDQISRAYLGKGIIYYYNRSQYKPALEEYLTAFKYSKNSKDLYLKNKIIYHLGMVKCYLGYYSEAALHFREAAGYFERKMKDTQPPEIRINNEAGYFNSIYRLSTCYKNLQLYKKEDSLIDIGLERLPQNSGLLLELGYFRKGKGGQLLRKGRSNEALEYFVASKDILSRQKDYASLTTVYFYMGKLYWLKRDRRHALDYFNKVDSLVNQFWFVTPEIRSNYEYLIKDAQEAENKERQLYYTGQLLRADSVINADFAVLSSKIHREYDADTLMEEKKQLEKKHHKDLVLIYISVGTGIIFLSYMIGRSRKREKELNVKYRNLLTELKESEDQSSAVKTHTEDSREKSLYSPEIIDDILGKLKDFEERKMFLHRDLTLPIVAKMIGSNRTHLSYVLNVHRGMTFPMYLKALRIRYMTNLLLENSKYLNYSIDALAAECGMTNRQKFSSQFLEINGMRPIDFIRKRQQELKDG
ncbi:AraC family transcriptional regulator [Chryseobacterium sp. SN22]|uniref:helix-turn-helix domain-containing protein n=1 Tax=Chryseobacterium sp. SN22 TaxID=2606431 RepID=UPI0011EDEB18|nr:helix-turn-helix domain-containing protein [Chryseobacterium sp. SN22]KAA0126789.1 AraC family transcriptional regulator [Chryseobacterium sp. SN22]